MQRLARSLSTSSARAVKSVNVPIRNQRISELVPLINVSNLEYATQAKYLRTVHQALQDKGILQLHLGFADDDSHFLQTMISNLHKHHNHGLPIAHSAERGWFWDVRPSPESFQSHGHQARSETMQGFEWHTDCSYEDSPPRYFALQVLQPDRCGGGTLSVLKVDHLLRFLSPFAQEGLSSHNYRITVPPEFVKEDGQKHIRGNMLAVYPGYSQLRFRDDITDPLTENAAKALEELKIVLSGENAEEQALHLTPQGLPRGSIIIMDNRRWLHARNEVRDLRRHLRRVRWDATPFGPAGLSSA
ncbi:Clavaminate synthase-like protein [Aspergillus ruber CBS 135680]|uniref:Clavaminate synthase-like protein n=1 Tax=Aspergillus ruber (strain CBS 135680) TaxID=1388766 RepID=A0A017SHZ1_ASPRC|nr:Clavaminate synthase-like protein [Aspergillus ruber CBS 135680]EYE96557.1 Clavaminate synthase-like protein [Aspergillus ruber CBS 135680]